MSDLTLLQPDDFHLHLRDGLALKDTVVHAAHYHHRVLVMPNTKPPIRTLTDAMAYQQRIQSHINVKILNTPPIQSLISCKFDCTHIIVR